MKTMKIDWREIGPTQPTFVIAEIGVNHDGSLDRATEFDAEKLGFNVDYNTWVEPLPQFVTTDGPRYDGVRAGDHLFAQTAQSFTYLQRRLASGEITLPDNARPLYSLGREAQRSAPAV